MFRLTLVVLTLAIELIVECVVGTTTALDVANTFPLSPSPRAVLI